MSDKSKLIDINGLKTFKDNYDTEIDEKIAGAGVTVTKESIETALGYTPANTNNIPTKVSDLNNDAGYLTQFTEEDPTVPSHVKNITTQNISSWNAKAEVSDIPNISAWALQEDKPTYTASEVGALPNDTIHLSGDVPVTRKINGKALNADIVLSASDVNALPDTTTIPSSLSDFGITTTTEELNYVDGVTSNIQTQLNTKAPLSSPTFTGTPKAPTASVGTNTTQIATTAFVQTTVNNKISDLIDGAPETMDTLKEVSDAIAAHQEVTDALNSAIGNKVDKVSGMGLSTNDLTDVLKSNYDVAYVHANSAHAPSNAQANVIETIKVNGTALTPSSKAVNITVPTKVSELTNDSGFKTTDTDTKNTAGATNTSSKIFLVGATSQAASPQTYSHDTVYVGTDGCLYSGGIRVATEVTLASEPTNQVTGDFWLQEYN